jgi:predicted DNA-binding transcriptional regulator AlpA
MTDTTLTKDELARELGMSRSHVYRLCKRGLPILPDGKVNRDAAVAWLNTYKETARPGRPASAPDIALPADRERLLEAFCDFIAEASAAEVAFMSDAMAHWRRQYAESDHTDIGAVMAGLADAGLRYRARTRTERCWTV